VDRKLIIAIDSTGETGNLMCGRSTPRAKPEALAEEFDLHEVPPLQPRFNIAPNQPVAVVRFDPNNRACSTSISSGLDTRSYP
jgi:putative SOS response-associated peptidase YedK